MTKQVNVISREDLATKASAEPRMRLLSGANAFDDFGAVYDCKLLAERSMNVRRNLKALV